MIIKKVGNDIVLCDLDKDDRYKLGAICSFYTSSSEKDEEPEIAEITEFAKQLEKELEQ